MMENFDEIKRLKKIILFLLCLGEDGFFLLKVMGCLLYGVVRNFLWDVLVLK